LSGAVAIGYTSGSAIDLTIRLGAPQLEPLSVPSSPILTSGAAAARVSDSLKVTGANFNFWGASGNSSVIEYALGLRLGAANSARFSTDGALANTLEFVTGGASNQGGDWVVNEAGVATATVPSATTAVAAARHKCGVALASANDAYGVADYFGPPATDTGYNAPAPNQLEFLPTHQGPLFEFMHWNSRVPNYVVKELTRL
jgi:hypothetical protein